MPRGHESRNDSRSTSGVRRRWPTPRAKTSRGTTGLRARGEIAGVDRRTLMRDVRLRLFCTTARQWCGCRVKRVPDRTGSVKRERRYRTAIQQPIMNVTVDDAGVRSVAGAMICPHAPSRAGANAGCAVEQVDVVFSAMPLSKPGRRRRVDSRPLERRERSAGQPPTCHQLMLRASQCISLSSTAGMIS